jgi:hypothetical protein
VASVNSTSAASKYSSPPLGDYYSNYVAAASSMASDPSALKFGYSDPTKGVQFAFGFPQHPDSFSALSYNGLFYSQKTFNHLFFDFRFITTKTKT